jgi:hypothetical protein
MFGNHIPCRRRVSRTEKIRSTQRSPLAVCPATDRWNRLEERGVHA